MTNPAAIQISAEIRVSLLSDKIIAEHTRIPSIGTNGTSGVLNGLTASGFFTRKIQMPTHTNTKANKVPKLVRSPATLPGTNPAKAPTKMRSSQFALKGVRCTGCNSENTLGTNPSLDIE